MLLEMMIAIAVIVASSAAIGRLFGLIASWDRAASFYLEAATIAQSMIPSEKSSKLKFSQKISIEQQRTRDEKVPFLRIEIKAQGPNETKPILFWGGCYEKKRV